MKPYCCWLCLRNRALTQGYYRDDDNIWYPILPSCMLEPGHEVDIQAIMEDVQDALKHLHVLRGCSMEPSVYPQLRKYTKQQVHRKVRLCHAHYLRPR